MIEEVLILQGAEEDLLSAYIHFEKRNKEIEFYQDLDEKLIFLKQYPEAGRIYFGDFRRVLLKPRFSYGIYYRIHGSYPFAYRSEKSIRKVKNVEQSGSANPLHAKPSEDCCDFLGVGTELDQVASARAGRLPCFPPSPIRRRAGGVLSLADH